MLGETILHCTAYLTSLAPGHYMLLWQKCPPRGVTTLHWTPGVHSTLCGWELWSLQIQERSCAVFASNSQAGKNTELSLKDFRSLIPERTEFWWPFPHCQKNNTIGIGDETNIWDESLKVISGFYVSHGCKWHLTPDRWQFLVVKKKSRELQKNKENYLTVVIFFSWLKGEKFKKLSRKIKEVAIKSCGTLIDFELSFIVSLFF